MFIYTIRNKENDNVIYIGSTKQQLNKRFLGHLHAFKQGKSMSLYNFIRENEDNIDNYYIELYENFSGTVEELKKTVAHFEKLVNQNMRMRQKPKEIIRSFKQVPNMLVINHNIAGRTSLQYMNERYKNDTQFREEHKQKMKEHMNEKYKNDAVYRQEHQEKVKERYRDRKQNEANIPSIIEDITDRYFL